MPTLRDLRRSTADRVAPFELATTGVAEGAAYVGTALSASRRRIVSTDLVSIDSLGTGPENPNDYLKNEWVYLLTDPPQQRRVPEAAFVGYARVDEAVSGTTVLSPPDTPVSYFDTERGFQTVVPAGVEFELHGIPPLRGGRSAGLHAHIQHALRVITRADTVLIPGVSGQTVLDVTVSLPWITHPGCFRDAHYVQTVAGVESYAIPGASLRFDGEKVLLTPNTMVTTGQSLPVEVLRPLSSWIKPVLSSVWVESATGLVDEDDQCLGATDSIALVAAFHVAEEQAHLCPTGSAEAQYWLARAAAFASRSVFLKDQRTPRSRHAGAMWPDYISPDGPTGGRWPPYFR